MRPRMMGPEESETAPLQSSSRARAQPVNASSFPSLRAVCLEDVKQNVGGADSRGNNADDGQAEWESARRLHPHAEEQHEGQPAREPDQPSEQISSGAVHARF